MDTYHSIYDHFIGDFNCIHVILFNILDDYTQLEQNLIYWLEFLRVRISVQEPLSLNGRSSQLAKVVLVGTHADLVVDCTKTDEGDYTCEVSNIFSIKFELVTRMISISTRETFFSIHEQLGRHQLKISLVVSINTKNVFVKN